MYGSQRHCFQGLVSGAPKQKIFNSQKFGYLKTNKIFSWTIFNIVGDHLDPTFPYFWKIVSVFCQSGGAKTPTNNTFFRNRLKLFYKTVLLVGINSTTCWHHWRPFQPGARGGSPPRSPIATPLRGAVRNSTVLQ